MIGALLAVMASTAVASASAPTPKESEQLLLQQIHQCAVEEPMPDFCGPLLKRLMEGGEQ
jgi:hypothetical protein